MSDEDIPSLIQLLSSAAQLLQDEPNVSTAEVSIHYGGRILLLAILLMQTLLKAASAFLDLDQLKQLNQVSVVIGWWFVCMTVCVA